jgi:general L-amino acid transport system permease protein
MVTTTTSKTHSRPPFWRDLRVLRVVGQFVAIILVGLVLWWLFTNLVDNLNRAGIRTDFGFLTQPTQFTVPYFNTFNARNPVWQMVLVGVKNTFLAGSVGIIIASVLGLVVGILRLSNNWLAARLATVFVEFFRNIPPLVVIVFFGSAVFTFGPLPILSEALELRLPGSSDTFLLLSNDRWGIPGFTSRGSVPAYLGILVVGLVISVLLWIWRTRVNLSTGEPHHRVLWSLGALLAFAGLGYLALGGPFGVEWPSLSENRRLIVSGFAMNWGFMALTGALGLYTASHIAEIVRGSIQAVPKGQTEASSALALSAFQRYRFVVLPQALRIAVPPVINQYLNLVKNTSLGLAVAYAELTALTQTSIANGRPAVQSIVVMMAIYLAFSLTISLALNLVNRRLQLVTR